MRYVPELPKMDTRDLFWLAGLLEGEGAFMRPSPSAPMSPRIVINMTDEDIITRVAGYFGVNYVYKGTPRSVKHKKNFVVQVKGKNAVRLMEQLYPLMGERRKKQIESAIDEHPNMGFISSDENWLYWLAGLLEGEGSFLKGMPSKPNKPRVHLNMTDKDVIEHAARLMQVNPKGPYKRTGADAAHKPRYFATVADRKAVDLMQRLRPLMGQRRQGQIDVALASYEFKGHPQGDTHPQAKLTADKVREIRRRLVEGCQTQSSIAAEFGVDTGLIWQIKTCRIWQHVE